MLATLTLPASIDPTFPQRTPTVRVRSADDLRNALRLARANGLRLDGSGMDRVMQLDDKRRLIEVQAASPWTELVRYLASRKIALDTFASMTGTVGDAVAQAAAGPDGVPIPGSRSPRSLYSRPTANCAAPIAMPTPNFSALPSGAKA